MSTPTSLSAIRSDALARRDRGDLNGARHLMEQALEGATMISGEDHPEVLHTAHLLASLHRQAGDLSGARRVLENALHAGTHRHGEAYPLLLAISFDLGELADELGNRHEARKHFSKVAGLGQTAAGFDQQKVLAAQAWLGPVNVPPATPTPDVVTPVYQPVTPTTMPPVTTTTAPQVTPTTMPPVAPVSAPPTDRADTSWPLRQPSTPVPPLPTHRPQQPVYQPQQSFNPPPVSYVASAPQRVERPSMMVPPPTVFTPVPAAVAPPARRNTAMMVMTIMSALVAVVAATVTVYLLVRPGGNQGGEIADRGPATDLTIVSATDGDITLRWTDPSQGEALQVIRYVRQGENNPSIRPISSGVTQQTLPGLNSNWDYCFQLLTIYAVDNTQASEQVCTDRNG